MLRFGDFGTEIRFKYFKFPKMDILSLVAVTFTWGVASAGERL